MDHVEIESGPQEPGDFVNDGQYILTGNYATIDFNRTGIRNDINAASPFDPSDA